VPQSAKARGTPSARRTASAKRTWRAAAGRFVDGILGDLPEHDARYGGELLPTLLAYLRQGGAAGAAADALKIHRNTLTYRLRRIEEICKRSPLDPDQHLSLHLAAILFSLNGAV
jgi:DNA-binding PucR family transcriptional regulator